MEWNWDKGRNEILEEDAALAATNDLDAIVRRVIPKYHGLGDSCDFITLAAEWPYRYRTPKIAKNGVLALDDLFGRDPGAEGTRAALYRQARRQQFPVCLSGDVQPVLVRELGHVVRFL